jgi:hypothetical protein
MLNPRGALTSRGKMNDGLRAAVFARDKGICSFSGLSVWYLDHGTAPFAHADWVDHVKPRSRNGTDTLDNLVCASHFYNQKKLNNSSDCQYLFSEGKPTETFFWTHGELSLQQASLLASHAALKESDWYFNRAIFNIMVAVADELAKVHVVRKREYWMASAYKRIEIWKRITKESSQNFIKRGLVRYPHAADVKLMLSLVDASNEAWPGIYRALLKLTRENETTLNRFLRAKYKKARLEVISEAEAKGVATQPLLEILKRNATRLE